jgi:hypothetical protein
MFTTLASDLSLQRERKREPIHLNYEIEIVVAHRALHKEVTHEATHDNDTLTPSLGDTKRRVDYDAQRHGAIRSILFGV